MFSRVVNGSVSFFVSLMDVGEQPYGVHIADFDGDGFPDVVVSNQGSNSISVLKNPASPSTFAPTFAPPVSFFVGRSPIGLWAADYNQDGKLDVAVCAENMISVLLNTATGNGQLAFSTTPSFFGAGNGPVELIGADLEKDGGERESSCVFFFFLFLCSSFFFVRY